MPVFGVVHQFAGQIGIGQQVLEHRFHPIVERLVTVDHEAQGVGLGIAGVHEHVVGQFTDTILVVDTVNAHDSGQADQERHQRDRGESEHQFGTNGPVQHTLVLSLCNVELYPFLSNHFNSTLIPRLSLHANAQRTAPDSGPISTPV